MANGSAVDAAEVKEVARETVDILKPESCPAPLKKFYNDLHREAIRNAVEAGHISYEVKNVRISSKASGTGKDETWPFVLYKANNAQGMSALARGKNTASKPLPENIDKLSENEQKRARNDNEDGAADYFNYGFGLTITQPIRVMLASSLGGVDKEVDKQIRQVMKTGLFASEDAARAFVIDQRKNIGLAVPDAFAEDAEE